MSTTNIVGEWSEFPRNGTYRGRYKENNQFPEERQKPGTRQDM